MRRMVPIVIEAPYVRFLVTRRKQRRRPRLSAPIETSRSERTHRILALDNAVDEVCDRAMLFRIGRSRHGVAV
jgi:hypothetical protein